MFEGKSSATHESKVQATITKTTKSSKLRILLKRLWTIVILGDFDLFVSTCQKITLEFGVSNISVGHLNKFGWTALHSACYYGRLQFV